MSARSIDSGPSADERPPAGCPDEFDHIVLPHLGAAYRLARWLVRNDHDAEDIVQEAVLRGLRYFHTFTGGNARAWFLSIVRNTALGSRGRASDGQTEAFDEERHRGDRTVSDPEALMLRADDAVLIERAITQLPERFRELLVLREFKGLSYREIADAIGIPMGTVMSGLSRARQALRDALNDEVNGQRTAGGVE
jgi:RNA polymerase sigma-70 factor (ECF subfamily)